MIRLLPRCPQLEHSPPGPLAGTLRTGDLLLFAGRGPISDTIRFFTRSHWSHIGMVVRLPEHDTPLILESTTLSESADIHVGAPVAGVGLVPIMKRIEEYDGDIALRQRLGEPLTDAQQRMVARIARRLHQRPYKNYVLTLARDTVTGFRRRPDFSGMFCSELVAEIYRRLGWLAREQRPSLLVPGHFGSERMTLRQGSLAPPVLLRAATASAVPAPGMPARPRRIAAGERLPLPQ
ncbi:hypothetical protein A167_02848 [Alcanivorax sp. S71-1-4]|uniref:hypothetical protein n=1 Tax=Alcanivorax sp. S71-1-4 TaxID=1177159 RepID=UPI00135A9B5C|nr:hypothetical protein [Alcanivorax sp. S71-1-4]KAF0807516.1 hypothetical protein A167_02848 [Alcanivorax sp. S71-1-4]